MIAGAVAVRRSRGAGRTIAAAVVAAGVVATLIVPFVFGTT